jgi:hypothetical protein
MCLQAREEEGMTWSTLVRQGYIEYVDTEEEETTMIAMTIRDLQAARADPKVCSIVVVSVCLFVLFVCLFDSCSFATNLGRKTPRCV